MGLANLVDILGFTLSPGSNSSIPSIHNSYNSQRTTIRGLSHSSAANPAQGLQSPSIPVNAETGTLLMDANEFAKEVVIKSIENELRKTKEQEQARIVYQNLAGFLIPLGGFGLFRLLTQPSHIQRCRLRVFNSFAGYGGKNAINCMLGSFLMSVLTESAIRIVAYSGRTNLEIGTGLQNSRGQLINSNVEGIHRRVVVGMLNAVTRGTGFISAYSFHRLGILWALGISPTFDNLAITVNTSFFLTLAFWTVRDIAESSIYYLLTYLTPPPSFSSLPDHINDCSKVDGACISTTPSRAVSPEPTLHSAQTTSHITQHISSGTAGHPPTPAEGDIGDELSKQRKPISARSVAERLSPPTLIYAFYPTFVARFAAMFLANIVTYPLETAVKGHYLMDGVHSSRIC
ncbi:hypothetical protein SeMB42_g01703 [Synchytrium endobioticum]|uniref:Uncharacterized protein n=1 Tax=Synchytrium endobioticum TaxID=286115 RepID=A0A507DLD0_9FUNG|nr:hypothetical protein SeMB42_g01703 [Synchytrium endobioticum]